MHDDRSLVEERLDRLRKRVDGLVWSVVAPVRVAAWRAPGEPVDFSVARQADFADFRAGTWWGPAWSTWWLHASAQVPESARDLALELRVDLGFLGDWAGNQSEGMVFTRGGTPLKGVNPMNRTVPLNRGGLARALAEQGNPLIAADGTVDLFIEAAANPNLSHMIGEETLLGDTLTAPDEPLWRFGGAELVSRNEDVWGLSLDLDVLDGLMRQLPEHSTRRAVLLRGLEDVADILDLGGIVASAARARSLLATLLASPANASAQIMTAVGHAHIDSAWLWPVRETKRKILRTFANVTALADEYSDLHFACTSAQHYQWLKETSPEVFQRVLDAIGRGQWHPVGGMWVESDTNLPGGESLVRQFTSGLRWMVDELGVRPDCLWLPDSFGYTGALPQIARLAGMRWFFTQKLSWNRTNTLPHHTFWWEGIDGTRIWTHFPPVDCYDSVVSPEEVIRAERNFKEKGRARESLLPFGYGDGGGGPTREMMERVRRLGDLEDAPAVRSGSPSEFFRAALAEYPDAPTWAGELYLEFHRGVYTTQHALKQGNRRSEHLLAAIELLAAMAAASRSGHGYPAEALEGLWRRVLLLQFHDILPGSSTSWVNREAQQEYVALNLELESLLREQWEAMRDVATGNSVYNAAPVARREVVRVGQRLLLVQVDAAAVAPLDQSVAEPANPVVVTTPGEEFILDNGLVRVTIGPDGTLTSLHDLARDREVLLRGGRGNLLRLHPDHPSCFDAWELEAHHRHGGIDVDQVESIRLVEQDPLRAAVEVTRVFGSSRAVQTIALDADSKSVDFTLWIDWRERERVLKVGFPLAVRASRTAAEIQFGHIERPVGDNTSWDSARFEASGHRWLHVAEPGYGVALANDSSHGHDVTPAGGSASAPTSGVDARLTLLRAPQSPDPRADLGEHTMRYCLTLDAGIREANAAGLRCNQPLRVLAGRRPEGSFVEVQPNGRSDLAFVDAVKQAFDGSGDVVVRLHEALGASSDVLFRLAECASSVTEVDLLEEESTEPTQTLPEGPIGAGEAIPLRLRPFQILTLRFRRNR